MESIEISDRDGDALTLTTDADGVWITCTHGEHEVTVGPLITDDLYLALTHAAPSTQRKHAGSAP
ncbi:hypothetical protein ACTXJK_12915 [Brachybacterium tyrofermentans]|uniref:hypothetical protein n=1 Tax=Brachybacterium tyrofermentans TaxID=47848 RepID=UPI003FD4A439